MSPLELPLSLFRRAIEKQPDFVLRLARWWIGVGSLVALFIGAIAIAHYVYGVPMQDRTTGQLSTPENTLTIFLLIGGGGLLFVIMGAMLLRWASARR